jgi:hypothetical protein
VCSSENSAPLPGLIMRSLEKACGKGQFLAALTLDWSSPFEETGKPAPCEAAAFRASPHTERNTMSVAGTAFPQRAAWRYSPGNRWISPCAIRYVVASSSYGTSGRFPKVMRVLKAEEQELPALAELRGPRLDAASTCTDTYEEDLMLSLVNEVKLWKKLTAYISMARHVFLLFSECIACRYRSRHWPARRHELSLCSAVIKLVLPGHVLVAPTCYPAPSNLS